MLRLLTRGSALVPAVLVTAWAGEGALTELLVMSQVVLSLQLPFAVIPLVCFCSRRKIMGALVAPRWLTAVAGGAAAVLVVLDCVLIATTLAGGGMPH